MTRESGATAEIVPIERCTLDQPKLLARSPRRGYLEEEGGSPAVLMRQPAAGASAEERYQQTCELTGLAQGRCYDFG